MKRSELLPVVVAALVGALIGRLADAKTEKSHWDDHPEDRQTMVYTYCGLGVLLLLLFLGLDK